MYLLQISEVWVDVDDGYIATSIEKELLFSTLDKAEVYLNNLPKKKNRSIKISEFVIDSEENPQVIRDKWWCE